MDNIREIDIEQYLVEQVEQAGGICPKFISPSMAGMPDRVVMLPNGTIAFVEVKRPGQHPRALQQYRIEQLLAQGQRALYVDSYAAIDNLLNTMRHA